MRTVTTTLPIPAGLLTESAAEPSALQLRVRFAEVRARVEWRRDQAAADLAATPREHTHSATVSRTVVETLTSVLDLLDEAYPPVVVPPVNPDEPF